VVEDLADTLHRRVRLGVRDNFEGRLYREVAGAPAGDVVLRCRPATRTRHRRRQGLARVRVPQHRSAGGRLEAAGLHAMDRAPPQWASTHAGVRSVASAMPRMWASCTGTAGRWLTRSWTLITLSSPPSRPRLTTSEPAATVVPALTFAARCLGREITLPDEWAVKTAECAARMTVSATELDSVGVRHHRADADEPPTGEITRTASRTAGAAVRPASHGADEQGGGRRTAGQPRRPTATHRA
jgi:hypothetical protein